MKAGNFYKMLEKEDNEEIEQERVRVQTIIREELQKRLTVSQLTEVDYDQELQKNYEIRKEKCCIICLDNLSSMAFVPCGHKHICKGCAPKFKSNKCPVCRVPITGLIEIFEN